MKNHLKVSTLLLMICLAMPQANAKKETKAEKDKRMAYDAEGCHYMDMKQKALTEEMFGDSKNYKSPKFCQDAFAYMQNEYGTTHKSKEKPKN